MDDWAAREDPGRPVARIVNAVSAEGGGSPGKSGGPGRGRWRGGCVRHAAWAAGRYVEPTAGWIGSGPAHRVSQSQLAVVGVDRPTAGLEMGRGGVPVVLVDGVPGQFQRRRPRPGREERAEQERHEEAAGGVADRGWHGRPI